MAKNFYGIVETTKEHKEEYTTKNKKGNTVKKSRTVKTPKSVVVTTDARNRMEAMQDVKAHANKVNGKVAYVGVFG